MIDLATRDRYEKIANLIIAEVPQVQIAAVVGLDESRISQIKNEPEFQEIYGALAAQQVEQGREMNDAWNAIEQDAMAVVIANLQHTKDPDFALKAALIANKAVRRGGRGNQPIPTDLGTRTVLNLSQTFVTKIENNGLMPRSVSEGGFSIPMDLMKYNDVQTPGNVERMLQIDSKQPTEVSPEKQEIKNVVDDLFNS